MLKLNLEKTGRYRVREVNDPTEALESATGFRPDLIILDLVMSKLHGSDLAEAIRSDPLLGETPIVFLTASAWRSKDLPNQLISRYPVISKPASMTEIVDAIEANLLPDVDGDVELPPTPKLSEASPRSLIERVRRLILVAQG